MPLSNARQRLIVALDVPDISDAQALVRQLGSSVSFYKVGMELIYAGGLELVRELIGEGKDVFVDLKLHDIPNTVERATAQIAKLGARFLTIHGFPQTMRAAKAGVAGSNLQLLAVTVMTSYDDADLKEAGYGFGVKELVARRGAQAKALGIDGLILSPEELEVTRTQLGLEMLLVTPGIRPAGAAVGDQKRIMTPARAVSSGANHIVVGRPITQNADPKGAADAIVLEISQALEP